MFDKAAFVLLLKDREKVYEDLIASAQTYIERGERVAGWKAHQRHCRDLLSAVQKLLDDHASLDKLNEIN